MIFSTCARVSGFLSHSTSVRIPASSKRANAASISVQSLVARPATAFHPGISFPERQASSAEASMSLSHFATSCPSFRYFPISSKVRSAGSSFTLNASSTFFSARALQRPLALQYLQVFGPGTKSPTPWIASAARSFTTSPNFRRSSRLHSHSEIPSGSLGCTIDIRTVWISYRIRYASYAPNA